MKFEVRNLIDYSYFHLPPLTEAGIIHGFMTKSSDSVVRDERRRQEFVEALGASDAIVMDQVHGDAVHVVRDGYRPAAGDGLILLEKGVMGVIKTADCLPIILCDPSRALAAIVHAGWRGTAARIAQKAISLMSDLGAGPRGVTALIGPGIGPCCYEIGENVRDSFRKARFSEHDFEKRGMSVFLDLKRANREALQEQGVCTIHDVGLCTSCRQDLFFSARRNIRAGRQISFVLLKG